MQPWWSLKILWWHSPFLNLYCFTWPLMFWVSWPLPLSWVSSCVIPGLINSCSVVFPFHRLARCFSTTEHVPLFCQEMLLTPQHCLHFSTQPLGSLTLLLRCDFLRNRYLTLLSSTGLFCDELIESSDFSFRTCILVCHYIPILVIVAFIFVSFPDFKLLGNTIPISDYC